MELKSKQWLETNENHLLDLLFSYINQIERRDDESVQSHLYGSSEAACLWALLSPPQAITQYHNKKSKSHNTCSY